jgi:hypothetical protein
MIRAVMTGEQCGFRAEVSIKGGPVALERKDRSRPVNGAEPRFEDYRMWKPATRPPPAVSVLNAFRLGDRWNAKWMGWWENSDG